MNIDPAESLSQTANQDDGNCVGRFVVSLCSRLTGFVETTEKLFRAAVLAESVLGTAKGVDVKASSRNADVRNEHPAVGRLVPVERKVVVKSVPKPNEKGRQMGGLPDCGMRDLAVVQHRVMRMHNII